MPNPDFILRDEHALRSLFEPIHEIAVLKSLPRLDKHARDFIRRSPFLCLGTQSSAGKADVSPRGDPAGFVSVVDDQTLVVPDRPGNNRLDSLANIISNPSVGLLFMVPGFDETLRVNGQAVLSTEPALLASMKVNERAPKLAIVVKVQEVFLHCAKAFRRSHLWDPSHHQDRKDMPSLLKMIMDQTTGAPNDESEMRKIDEGLETAYKNSMY